MATKKKNVKDQAQQTDYEKRGVSQDKAGVTKAAKILGDGIIPNTFAKVLPDIAGNKRYGSIPHEDGTGTKSLLAYLIWKETGNIKVWRDIIIDAIVMNLDDIFCATAKPTKLQMSMVINRNKHLVPDLVITEIIAGAKDFCAKLQKWGINIEYVSGETADMGDVVRTITIDVSMSARTLRKDVVTLNSIREGDIIVGLASFGQTEWEDKYNSGIGSNGFTNARHDVLSPYYKGRYPETFSPETDKKLIYRGEYKLGDFFTKVCSGKSTTLSVGELLLSPTRTYAPFLKALHKKFGSKKYKKFINGVIHNSGGGQKKVLGYLRPGLRVWKNSMHEKILVPPVFELLTERLRKYNPKNWQWEAYKTFNMGQRMELYCSDVKVANEVIALAQKMNLQADIIGKVYKNPKGKKSHVIIGTYKGDEVIYE